MPSVTGAEAKCELESSRVYCNVVYEEGSVEARC